MEVAKELSSFSHSILGFFVTSKIKPGEPVSARLASTVLKTFDPQVAKNVSEIAQQSYEKTLSVLSIFGCYGSSKAFLLSPNIFLCSTLLSAAKVLTGRLASDLFFQKGLSPQTDTTTLLVKATASTLSSFDRVGVKDSSQILSLTSTLISAIHRTTLKTVSSRAVDPGHNAYVRSRDI